MNLKFENQGTNTYLVYEIQPGDELDTMTLGMLTNNAIPGLAAVTFQQVDTTKYIKFNVTAKVSVSQLFSGPVNKKRLMGVLYGVINAISSAEDYMLDPDMLLLDLDHMYSDVSTCETVLICLPVMNGGHGALELNKFFKNIIFNTQFDQTENCDYVAQILNYLNSTPNLSLTDFKNLLDSIHKPKAAPAVQAPAAPQPVPQPMPQPAPQPMPQSAPQPMPAPAPQSAPQPIPVQRPAAPAGGWQPVMPQTGAPAYGQPAAPAAPPAKNAKKGKKAQPAPANFAVPGQQPQQAPGNFAVPGQQPQSAPAATAPGEKPMSWLYLMQHYNKENAAKYKEQQQAKKAEGAAKPAKAPKQQAPGGFAVPGQQPQPLQAPGGFAVPGKQPQPQQAPGGYPVPGKQPQPQQAPGGYPVPDQQPRPQQAPGGFAVPGKQPQAPQMPGGYPAPGKQPQPQQAPGGYPVPGKQPQAPQAPGGYPVPGKQPQPQQAPGGFPVPGKQPQYQPPQPPVQQPVAQPLQQPAFNSINFGETTVLGGDDDFGATTVLSAMPEAAKPVPYLLRRKNSERIPLNKPVFRIGKEKSYVDYFIADNPAISRSHANIIDRDGTFYVVDTNSTNHTYVNNVMSPSNAETKLNHGDKLTLGNEEFEFKMV